MAEIGLSPMAASTMAEIISCHSQPRINTCPAEIQRLQADGVQVFLHSRLHAKVMLCGNKAVVGSANLSQSSMPVS
jgi:hypothetical protein